MFDKIDYKTVRMFGREVRITINHRERSISARANDGYPSELTVTGYLARRLAIGASVRVEYGGDEDVLAGLYLGPLRLYLAGSHRALGNILAACKTGRRVTSIEAELGERFGDEGTEIRVRGNLWNDDNEGHPRSRAFSVDLLDSLFGKTVTSDKCVIEERMAVVPLPEGSFTTKARLVERFVSRPGWPFKTFSRRVEFRETPAVVPRRKSNGVSFYNQGGPWTGITGSTIEDGVAELVRRVLEDRGRYGGKRWATGIPVIEEHRDSHEVSVWQIVDGKEIEHWRGALQHRSMLVKDGTVSAYSPVSLPDAGLCLSRDARVGGIVASSIGGKVLSIQRGGETISPFLDGHAERAIVFQGDKVHTERGCWKIYGSPIGPLLAPPAAADVLGPVWKDPTPATPAGPVDVRAATILARGEAACVHVNAGPAIGKTGRIPLRGMTASAIGMARSIDPEWVAANQEIVAGAGPGKLYDGARWVTVLPEGVRLAINNPDREGWASFNFPAKLDWYEAQERAKQDAAAQAELDRSIALVDDVERTLAQLDTTPPGPTEEADGLSARERALAGARRPRFGVDLAAGGSDQQLGKDVALTAAKVRESKEAVAGAKQALETHNATVAAFGANSAQAAQSAAKLATAEREAAKAAAVAAEATAKLAKEVQAVAAAEDGQLSPATKRAAAAVARMGETAERTAHDLNKMELQTVTPGYVIQDGVLHRVGEPRVLDPAYIGEVSRQYAQAFDAGQTAVSALSAVLGNGEADFSPAPVDTRPWLPTGPLTVVITRGETKTTVRLPRATSYRVGAHKDAEIRLLGAHMLGALIEQDNGGVWVRRRSDNVAVDLLGLEPGEAVQLREGAEVQIGQLYTLTITSRSA